MQALCPTDDNPDEVPSTLPEVLMLAQDQHPEAPAALSNTLWYKYRASRQWTRVVWDNVIASLHQVPAVMVTQRDRFDRAAKYAKFLLHVDEHCADGIDVHAQEWFRENIQHGLALMTSEALEVCVAMFIHLVVQADSTEKWISASVGLHAANTLFNPLVLQSMESVQIDGSLPPSNLTDMQSLKARRGEVYSEARFRRLIDMLPALVVIQNNAYIEEPYRLQAQDLVRELSKSPEFCLATTRYFNIVLATFVKALEPGMFAEEMHEGLMTMLHLVSNNGVEGTSTC
jgi:mediator of RNA polymerase II transcription subunit 12